MPRPFLHEKFPDLQTSKGVRSAVKKKEHVTEKRIPNEPEERIEAYLERLEGIFANPDQDKRNRGVRLLTHMIHEEYVVKPEDVPESYFKLQQRIAREQGHGDIEIAPQMRREMIGVIRKDQETSLNAWIDYLGSPTDNAYPNWFKYFAFRSMLKMSSYDKEKKAFRKRTASTTAPYPDLNREALAYVCDVLVKDQKQEHVTADAALQTLLKRSNFAELYAHAIEKVTPASQEEKETIEGEWKRYPEGSDAVPLWKSLQGHGTGWCTAGESTAQAQLKAGDFHVYYTKDANGGFTTPRVAIRMEQGHIAEVRGINKNQELEPKLIDIAQARLKSLPGHEAYEKKSRDMKRLTEIEKKTQGDRLSKDDLRYLYELDAPIEGFGYERDPRIDELRSKRNRRKDLATIFNCTEEELDEKEHVALSDIPTFSKIPAEASLKKDFKFDWIWKEEYRGGRDMKDFALQETDFDAIKLTDKKQRKEILDASTKAKKHKEFELVAKVFDIGDVIERKKRENPNHPNSLTSKEVFEAIDDAEYRSATLEELLAFAKQYWKPDVGPTTLTDEEKLLQRVNAPFIYALGSPFTDSGGGRDVPYLRWGGGERELHGGWLDGVWLSDHRFLVLRK